MINRLSERITNRWVSKRLISEEDYELYHYGWFIVLSDLWMLLFTSILGIIFKAFWSSLVFFVTFFIVRRFAGGFHAKTELHCQIISLSFLSISIISIKYLFLNINSIYLFLINLVCIIVLPFISPADTPQKVLSPEERKKFKIITGCISFAFMIINCIMLYYRVQFVSAAIVCAFALETILVAFGRMFNFKLSD